LLIKPLHLFLAGAGRPKGPDKQVRPDFLSFFQGE
jgi:hypothetical protein